MLQSIYMHKNDATKYKNTKGIIRPLLSSHDLFYYFPAYVSCAWVLSV